MRAVFDSNVLVSALLNGGVCRRLWEQATLGHWRLLLSPDTTQELLTVLSRPKFGLAPGQGKLILAQDILPFAEVVQPGHHALPFPCRDPKDDKFLRCAMDGKAQMLVTGDKDLLVLKKNYEFELLDPRAALEKLESRS